jgi:hypothetical protein
MLAFALTKQLMIRTYEVFAKILLECTGEIACLKV